MDLVEDTDGTTLTMHLRGELDMATVPPFRQIMASRIGSGDYDTVVVDLGGLTFTDSAGLTILVEANDQAAASEVSFVLTGVSRQVLRLLEITSLLDLFDIR
jgi:anti-sigma B factor antagonist